ncbi:iron-regulated transporter [Amanita rubescens]|nr:iron-regulated transporter [Amanita rubescens]
MSVVTDQTPLLEEIRAAADSNRPLDGVSPNETPPPATGTMEAITSRRVYVSHFFSTWNSRIFEFGATLFLATIFPGTLLPTSVYALARSLSAILFSPSVGRYIDNNNRLVVVKAVHWIAVAISCAIFLCMMSMEDGLHKSSLLAAVTFLACAEKLSSIMNAISVGRDWVVVIAGGDESGLQTLNSQMRRIDLFCKLIGPFAISVLDGVSTRVAIVVTLSLNMTSVVIEYYAIKMVEPRNIPNADQRSSSSMTSRLSSLSKGLSIYFNHPVFRPSMSLALLYFTVLSFGGQMITFLLSVGFKATHIALARIVSVAFELSATWLAPFAMRKIGPIRAGLWFINWQALWVTVAGLLFIEIKSPFVSALGLVGGVIASRVGLWGFDLCAQVIIQEEVEAEHRGSFSSLCSYLVTIILSKPEQFRYPVLISPLAIYLAGVLFASFVRSRRGHLLHVPLCMKMERQSDHPWGQGHNWGRLPDA